jgi:hypothetical protein
VLKRSTAEGEKHKPCLVFSVSFWLKMTYLAELNKPGFVGQQGYEPERIRFGRHVFGDFCPENSVSRLTFGKYFESSSLCVAARQALRMNVRKLCSRDL